jgi:putative inorganic carbon (HCO3(-)) transporter
MGVLVLAFFTYRLGYKPMLETLTTTGSVSTLEGRQEIWSRAIFMIQDFAFTGIGMGTFGDVADAMYPFFLASPGSTPHAHNLFLQIAVDLGIPGLVAWLAIWMVMIAMAYQVYRHGRESQNGWASGLGAGLLCSQLALVSHGMLDAVTWGMVKPAPLVWALWGVTVASWYVYHKRP